MLSLEQALARLQRAPVLQARLGPLDANWHVEQLAVGGGALRACHVAASPAKIPALALEHALAAGGTVVRRHPATPSRASGMAAFWCTSWQAEDLEAQPEHNRLALAALGERFGVANRHTSLLVLESDEDYVRHAILPPQADVALRERVQQQRRQEEERRGADWAANREAVRHGWQDRVEWWNTVFPKDDPRPRWERERREAEREAAHAARESREASMAARATPAFTQPSLPAPAAAEESLDSVLVTGTTAADAPGEDGITMHLQAVAMDAPGWPSCVAPGTRPRCTRAISTCAWRTAAVRRSISTWPSACSSWATRCWAGACSATWSS